MTATRVWAPRWRDAGDEWEAFLGKDEDLYAFESVPDLVAFVRTDTDNDLVDHPAWQDLTEAHAHDFDPADDRQFDLVVVEELVAEKPTEESVTALAATLAIVSSIGSVCELAAVSKFFNGNPALGTVSGGIDNFSGKAGPQALECDRRDHRAQLGRRAQGHRRHRQHPGSRRRFVGQGGRELDEEPEEPDEDEPTTDEPRPIDEAAEDAADDAEDSEEDEADDEDAEDEEEPPRRTATRRAGQRRGLLGEGGHRPDPDHDGYRHFLHAALLPG